MRDEISISNDIGRNRDRLFPMREQTFWWFVFSATLSSSQSLFFLLSISSLFFRFLPVVYFFMFLSCCFTYLCEPGPALSFAPFHPRFHFILHPFHPSSSLPTLLLKTPLVIYKSAFNFISTHQCALYIRCFILLFMFVAFYYFLFHFCHYHCHYLCHYHCHSPLPLPLPLPFLFINVFGITCISLSLLIKHFHLYFRFHFICCSFLPFNYNHAVFSWLL